MIRAHRHAIAMRAILAGATCAPCHDGTAACKLTGTTCARCHQGGQP